MAREAKRRGIPEHEFVKRAITRLSNGGPANPEHQIEDAATLARQAKEEAAALRAELERRDTEAQQKAAAREEQEYLERYQVQAIKAVDPEKHPLVSDFEPHVVARMVLDVANRYFRDTGEVAPVEDVLKYLEDQEQKAVAARLDKHGARFGWTKAQQAAADAAAASRGGPAPVLSNGMASARGAPPVDGRKLSHRERLERAAEVLRAKKRAP